MAGWMRRGWMLCCSKAVVRPEWHLEKTAPADRTASSSLADVAETKSVM